MARLLVLSRTVLLLLAASVIAGLFPFQPWAPVWFLRVAQLLVDYSPALILALVLSLLAGFYEPRMERSARQVSLAKRIATTALILYGALVPVQLLSYGWLWLDTGSQVRAAISNAESRIAGVRSKINAAASSEQLQAAFANGQPLPPPAPGLPPLPEQKRQLLAAINNDLTRLSTTLNQQRNQQITGLLVSTLRGVAVAAIVAAGAAVVVRLS